MQADSLLVSSSSSRKLSSSQAAGAQGSPSSSRPRPALVFSRTPGPILTTPLKNGKKSLKKRPPTPGGPASNKSFCDFSTTMGRPSPFPSTAPRSAPRRSTDTAAADLDPLHDSVLDSLESSSGYPALPPGLGQSSPPLVEPRFSFTDQRRGSSPSSSISAGARRRQTAAMVAPLVFGVSGFGMMGVSSIPMEDLYLFDDMPIPTADVLPSHQASSAKNCDAKYTPSPSSATPPTSIIKKSDRELTRITIPENRPSSRSSSLTPDSPNTKALMDRLLSAPDYPGLGEPTNELVDDDDGSDSDTSIRFASTGARNDDAYDSDADVGKGAKEGDKPRIGAVDPLPSPAARGSRTGSKLKAGRLLGTTSDDEFIRPRVVEGFWSGDDSGAENMAVWTKKRLHQERSSGKLRVKDKGHHDALRRTRSGLPSPLSPQRDDEHSPRDDPSKSTPPPPPPPGASGRLSNQILRVSVDAQSGLAVPPAPSVGSDKPVRVYALESLMPTHQSVKRSHSASAVPVTVSTPRPRRSSSGKTLPPLAPSSNYRSLTPALPPTPSSMPPSPASPNWPSSETQGLAVDAPLITARTTSKASPLAAAARKSSHSRPEEIKLKEKRRRSALVWMKEHAGLITSRSLSTSDAQKDSSHHRHHLAHGRRHQSAGDAMRGYPPSHSDATHRLQVLGMDPNRSGSLPSAVSSSSNDSPSLPRIPDSASYSPFAPSFERFGMSGNSDHGHSSREDVVGGSVYTRKESVETSYHSHGHGSAVEPRERDLADVSPYYTVVGSRSSHTVPVGLPEDRWATYEPDHWDTEVSFHTTTTISAEAPKAPKSDKGLFGFGLKRTLSKKKPSGSSNQGEEKRHRNRLRGKSVTEASPRVDTFAASGSGKPPQDRTFEQRRIHRRSYSFSMDRLPGMDARSGLYGSKDSLPKDATVRDAGYSSSASKDGNKGLWKLVKRMGSNNALRDKYAPSSSQDPSRFTTSITSDPSGDEFLTRILSSSRRGSIDEIDSSSPSKPATPSKPYSSSRLKNSTGPSSADGHSRHTTRTRSSTPVSSDHVSVSKSNLRSSHSAHSSLSSLGDHRAAPPLPQPPSAYSHLMMSSPIERGHLSDSGLSPGGRLGVTKSSRASSKSRRAATDDEWSAIEPPTPTDFPSLPTPPRRPKPTSSFAPESFEAPALLKLDASDLEEFDNDDLLEIPSFSTENAFNTFRPRRALNSIAEALTSDDVLPLPSVIPVSTNQAPPPPRPARDARRAQAASGDHEDDFDNDEQGSKVPSTAPGPSPKATTTTNDYDSYGPRPLTSSFGPSSSLKASERADIDDRSLPTTDPVNVITISPQDITAPLTEKQKAAKWDALLRKSAKAGGTLHLRLGRDNFVEADGL